MRIKRVKIFVLYATSRRHTKSNAYSLGELAYALGELSTSRLVTDRVPSCVYSAAIVRVTFDKASIFTGFGDFSSLNLYVL